MRLALLPPALSLALLSACVQPPRPAQVEPRPPVQRPTVAPAVVAPAPPPATDAAVAAGVWTYEVDARGSRALFGMANTDALVLIRCERAARRIYISVPGHEAGTLTLRATSMVKGYPARPTAGAFHYVAADIAPTDVILDALAFSRGRFTVALGTRQTVVPAWPEFTRVVEDCRG